MTRLEIAVRLTEALLRQSTFPARVDKAGLVEMDRIQDQLTAPEHDENGAVLTGPIALYAWRIAGDLINLAVDADKAKP